MLRLSAVRRRHALITLAVVGIAAAAVYVTSPQEDQLPEVSPEPVGGAPWVYMTTGIKVGEVTSTSAIVWTRLTRDPETEPMSEFGRLVTGQAGDIRVTYWLEGQESSSVQTPWAAVDADKDFTRQVTLVDLVPGAEYALLVEGRPPLHQSNVTELKGSFKTAPNQKDSTRILFSVVSCQLYPRRDDPVNGFRVYDSMADLDLDFFVHTGDNVYYDQPEPHATNIALARFKWSRNYSLPFVESFLRNSSSYFMKDDHDTLKNDSFPGQEYGSISWQEGLELFREQVPMGDETYRTFRWGNDLQIWLVEGRDFRSPNKMRDGPDKTLWGKEQKDWLFNSVQTSDATFRILISPTPIVGPDHSNKKDNHSNAVFKTEGDEIRSFVASQENMFIVAGDRHWQYSSKDPTTGALEFGSGPASDALAARIKEGDSSPMQTYMNIVGGFLTVEVNNTEDAAQIIFRHHAVDGSINNEERFSAVARAQASL